MKMSIMAIIVSLLLLGTCVTAVVAENCRIKNNVKCANGSTIALTVTLSLIVALTSLYWFKPVFFPPEAAAAAKLATPAALPTALPAAAAAMAPAGYPSLRGYPPRPFY